MAKRTPRQFWETTVKGGFDAAISWIERLYGDIERPKPLDVKNESVA
jgi:hypothetical protein